MKDYVTAKFKILHNKRVFNPLHLCRKKQIIASHVGRAGKKQWDGGVAEDSSYWGYNNLFNDLLDMKPDRYMVTDRNTKVLNTIVQVSSLGYVHKKLLERGFNNWTSEKIARGKLSPLEPNKPKGKGQKGKDEGNNEQKINKTSKMRSSNTRTARRIIRCITPTTAVAPSRPVRARSTQTKAADITAQTTHLVITRFRATSSTETSCSMANGA